MIYSKLPISIADQIALMKSRGLIVGDEQRAEKELMVISYFRLADYLTPLEADKATHRFKTGATLDDALKLYYFDKE